MSVRPEVSFPGITAVLCAWFLPVAAAIAQAPVPVVTYPIPVHVEAPDKGLFIDLVRAVAQDAGVPIRISVQPPPRAIWTFSDGQQAVLFPALDVLFAPGVKVARSQETIDCKEDFVFTRRGTPLLTSLQDLKGLRVGITRGYPYDREVGENAAFTVEPATSDEANLRKLVAGHLDAFILDEKTGVRALSEAGLSDKVQYDPKQPVSRQDVYYAFHDTDEGRRLAERFSAALGRLKRDGRYHAITRGITFGNGCTR